MRRGLPRRTEGGFTLLETLVASVMLVLAVIPLIGFLQTLTRGTAMTRARVLAHAQACAIIERFRVEPFSALGGALAGPGAGERLIERDPLLALPPGPLAQMAHTNKLRRWVGVTPSGGQDRIATLVARVTWVEDSHQRSYELRVTVVDDVFPTGRPRRAVPTR